MLPVMNYLPKIDINFTVSRKVVVFSDPLSNHPNTAAWVLPKTQPGLIFVNKQILFSLTREEQIIVFRHENDHLLQNTGLYWNLISDWALEDFKRYKNDNKLNYLFSATELEVHIRDIISYLSFSCGMTKEQLRLKNFDLKEISIFFDAKKLLLLKEFSDKYYQGKLLQQAVDAWL